jgi:hypothetical protein
MSHEDLQLATMLLIGFVVEDRGFRSQNLVEGHPDELAARRAMVRQLRSELPLDIQLREHLANLFDPEGADSVDPQAPKWEQRKIIFKYRRKGPRSDYLRDTQIATDINAEMKDGKSYEDAIATASDKFGLSEDMVKKKWSKYRAHRTLLADRNDSPLPPGSQSGI